ncbi:flagellar filament capping protein FliD [Sandarakinorhabdus limnophila]|uniref:flagellar filament capping protein FliD n=1 Tax=Sandarakinorhabdus limnophila TaxID=210512 RepID=UPI0026E9F399|nr:flagellar filament capping protein FliD [Sandarakinorhabdus limnophila]MCM0032712.1 flagellar filament capping protein FliD [Sandarakinorhabdus limnophila]
MATNVLTAFNAGSGLDSRALVDGLVNVERETRSAPLTRRVETLTARISALGQLRSALSGIATSLDGRVRTGELGVQLASSDAAIAVERVGIGPASAVASGVVVNRLAGGQRLNSAAFTSGSDPVGLGTLSFQFGRRTPVDGGGFTFAAGTRPSVNVTIGQENNTLAGLARAINESGAGVTASIIASTGSATLVLRGPEGAENAFIISAAATGGPPGLERFNHTPGAETMVLGEAAQDAELVVDGVLITRGTNRIEDVIAGARLSLKRTTTTGVAITAARDGQAVSGALADFVGTLQAMRQLIGDFRRPSQDGEEPGPLANDPTARALDQRITRLITQAVPQANGLRLADLGVSIQRDGSITVDTAQLANLPATRLGDAEALLRELSGAASPTRPNRLQSIAQLAVTASEGLTRQRDRANQDLEKVNRAADVQRILLTRQFAAMDRAVAQSRATQVQLDQQIAFWTRRDD